MQLGVNIQDNTGLLGANLHLKSFPEVLKKVQEHISKNYADVLKNSESDNRELIKSYIAKFLDEQNIGVADTENDELCELIYGEMMAFHF